jgi:hypothetical protein
MEMMGPTKISNAIEREVMKSEQRLLMVEPNGRQLTASAQHKQLPQ